jgi:hypothetical protein
MFDLSLRDLKEVVLGWFCAPFADVHPNKLTLMSGLIGLFCAYFAALQQYKIALACWALNRTLDGLDGTVARRFNKQRFDFVRFIRSGLLPFSESHVTCHRYTTIFQ